MKEICSGGIVYIKKEGKINYLMLKSRKTGWWVFPKGHVKKNESLKDTTFREIKEETGLSNLNIHPNYYEIISFLSQSGNEKEVHHWLFEASEEKVKLSDEHTEFKWLEFDEAYNLIDHENQKRILNKANEVLIK